MEAATTDSRRTDAAAQSSSAVQRQPLGAIWLIPAVGIVFALLSYISFSRHDPADAMRCDMAYMWPGYVRIAGPDDPSGYALWLYREQGLDESHKPRGTPVLFIPGNAGSYKQVRSLASESAKQYYVAPHIPHADLYADGVRNLDWFAVDFNEDFSALDSHILQQQADYTVKAIDHVLGLYVDDERGSAAPPGSVILIAHSMGGIAARLAMTDPAMLRHKVKTIVTLSTPHLIPPVSIDRGMEHIYNRINSYWYNQYVDPTKKTGLVDMLLISIAGGTADVMIPSDYTAIDSFTPPTNGFTTFTISLPSLLSPVDHQAMAWCDQLRRAVIWSLLRSTTVRDGSRACKLDQRLSYFQHGLLGVAGGLIESETLKGRYLPLRDADFVRTPLPSFSIPPSSQAVAYELQRMNSDDVIGLYLSSGSARACLCTKDAQSLLCSPLQKALGQSLPQLDRHGRPEPLTALSPTYFAVETSAAIHVILVASDSSELLNVWIDVKPKTKTLTTQLVTFRSLLFGTIIEAPLGAVHTHVTLRHAANSLIVYALTPSPNTSGDLQPGLLRATAPHLHEAQYFSLRRRARLHLHAAPPFVDTPDGSRHIIIELWKPLDSSVQVAISIDWFASLGKLVLRYRGVLASWPAIFALQEVLVRRHHHVQGAWFWRFDGAEATRCVRRLAILGISFGTIQAVAIRRGIFPDFFVVCLLGTSDVLFLPLIAAFLAIAATVHLIIRCMLYAMFAMVAHVLAACRSQRRHPIKPARYSNSGWMALAALVCFTTFYAPMALASVILLLHLIKRTIAAYDMHFRHPSAQAYDAFICDFEILTIAFSKLPFDLATLAVWLRKLQFGTLAAFPSDHNILALAGLLLSISVPRSSRAITHSDSMARRGFLPHLILAGQVIILLVGARYTFVLRYVVNAVLCAVVLNRTVGGGQSL